MGSFGGLSTTDQLQAPQIETWNTTGTYLLFALFVCIFAFIFSLRTSHSFKRESTLQFFSVLLCFFFCTSLTSFCYFFSVYILFKNILNHIKFLQSTLIHFICVQSRDDHGAGVDSGRSLDFRTELEQESTLRSAQELIKYFKGSVKISVMMFVVFKQNGINWDVFSDQRRHTPQRCDTGREYRVFHHYWWFQKLVLMQNAVCKWL